MTRLLPLAVAFIVSAPFAAAEPMHIYLTYSGAPETSIDINVILPERVDAVNVHFDTRSRDGEPEAYSGHIEAAYHQTVMEISDERALYVARLTGLQPGTVYHFVTQDEETGISRERKFRTLPGGDKPFRFVNGGDMGVGGAAIPLQKLAGKTDADFALIGGDFAYANGLLENNRLWDRWLRDWNEHMVTRDGRMIPIVAAIGNHETNDYVSENFELTSPWYIGLFGRQAPEVYWTLRVGEHTVFYILDSGHLVPHDGAQREWLAAELERHKDVPHQFAAYHVPLYPGHRAYDGDYSVRGRTHWAPLFDQYNLDIALEHHDHVLKRTKPLRGGQVVEDGTIYVGDGTFGRSARTIDPQPRWYNEKEASIEHFWVIDVSARKLEFEAIDKNGKTVDRFSLPVR